MAITFFWCYNPLGVQIKDCGHTAFGEMDQSLKGMWMALNLIFAQLKAFFGSVFVFGIIIACFLLLFECLWYWFKKKRGGTH